MKTATQKNCAIYTRKSTEEGLDQEFNSLHAQREACEAYITSQKAEGWRAVKREYDDGGFSGGNMDRPGLGALLEDIKAGRVQIIVVYKIDRLTRSLMDFSKLVEVFDEHGVTFISITQSFNTTTSMGRLTLNMLLSFAQFEREVTSERIRDKIAASKKRGMWMGGFPPMGYQRVDKKLIPDVRSARDVEFIFKEYLTCGTVRILQEKLENMGKRTPVRTSSNGRKHGNKILSRGHIHRVLNNPIYIGKIKHKDEVYEGQHDPIIDTDLFEQVQNKLAEGRIKRKVKFEKSGSMLKGLIYDCDGVIYSPTYTVRKGNRYSYYISQNLIQYRDHPKGIMARIPAHEIEKTIVTGVGNWLESINLWQEAFPETSDADLQWITENMPTVDKIFIREIVNKITVNMDALEIRISAENLRNYMAQNSEISITASVEKEIVITTEFKANRGKNGTIIIDNKSDKNKDPFDLPADRMKRVVRGIIWRDEHFTGATLKELSIRDGHGQNYINRCIQEGFKFLGQ